MPASASSTDLHIDDRGVARCRWCISDPLYVTYHDTEWGFRQTDDRRLFEKIVLEGFQAGLSWLTILRKRERFRDVFHDFDFERIARMSRRDVNRLVTDAGIIRHRGKIESAINNAQRCLELLDEFNSIHAYVRQSPGIPILGRTRTSRSAPQSLRDISTKTDASTALSKDLRKRGWSFVGPTTMYAFLQATGFVNDHLVGCHVRERCQPNAPRRKSTHR